MKIIFLIALSYSLASLGNINTLVDSACIKNKVKDCSLVHSIIWVESNYRNVTIQDGKSLSYGPAQIKCATARMMGLKYKCSQLRNPKISIRFSILYLKYQLSRYKGDIRKTIASYNAGSAIVCKNYNKGKCYPNEFINEKYIWKVWRRYRWLRNKKQGLLVGYLWPYNVMDTLKRFPIGYKLESQIFLAATMGSF